ncbi:MAG: hypothetical protein J6B75_03930 [Ruminococcus sp.]|nr:hypothetical protein [Ruminococcus sp.]
MKNAAKVLLVVSLVGLILAFGGFSDTMLLFKGDTVNITDPIGEFDKKALAQGEIDFVYGPFATLEETNKTYGITTSKKETDFYIVGNLESGEGFAVLSTGNDDMKAELLAAADEWYEWLTSDEETPEPEISINFKGKLWEQYDDPDYDKYYSEAKTDLTNVGIGENEYASMRIIEGEVSVVSVVMFFGGIAVFLICIIIAIVAFVKAKKASRAELY